MWPPDDDLLAAWRRLVADPDTGGAFAEFVLSPLLAEVARYAPAADPGDHLSAAGDAVLAVLRDPGGYDPSQSPLRSYLRLIAGRKLINHRERDRKHRDNRIPLAAVEDDLPDGNRQGEGDDLPDFDSPALRPVVDSLSADERRVFDLMRAGERATAAFAHALGIADRPTGEQAAEVKRVKERVFKRLQRAAGREA
ncbi:MAG: hypothetical protein K2X82_06895 [Gemmataceae bacterium]|nr:hypothetical protein [Gemmataceae bacterium]